jgi:NADPH2:quinone reductase
VSEALVRKGAYAWMPPLPAVPGIEMTGTIAECSAGVTDRAIGEPVFVSAHDLPVRAGCYAEYIAVPAAAAHRLPAPPARKLGVCELGSVTEDRQVITAGIIWFSHCERDVPNS